MEKVGKAQVHQQAAAQNAREAELAKNRDEADKRVTTVQETEAGEEQTGKVRERKDSQGQSQAESRSESKDPEEAAKEDEIDREIIRDPDLGSHIDISG